MHRAPEGALRRHDGSRDRCYLGVRMHRAPEGALRRLDGVCRPSVICVRMHRAPEGALRQVRLHHASSSTSSQNAPCARRCITTGCESPCHLLSKVRMHRAPEGALRPVKGVVVNSHEKSECTVRQKVHYDPPWYVPAQLPAPCQNAPCARRCITTRPK